MSYPLLQNPDFVATSMIRRYRYPASGAKPAGRAGLDDAEVAAPLVRGDLAPVLLPLTALVAQEEVEDVLAQDLGDQLGVLHHVNGLGEVLRQRGVSHRLALGVGQRPRVVLG